MTIRIDAPRRVTPPGKTSHFHQPCQHFCFSEVCLPPSSRDEQSCRRCRSKAANDRMQAEYLAAQEQA